MGMTATITVNAGATSPAFFNVPVRATLTLAPGSGGSMNLEYTTSSEAEVFAGSARWVAWDKGSVTATTSQVTDGPITAVRASAVAANGFLEVRSE